MKRKLSFRNDLPETCFSVLPSSGQLIIIQHGERGYYPSEWVQTRNGIWTTQDM